MTQLAWPLARNQIRRNRINNAFGMVRNGGARAHQGWDLVAAPGTPCYAIADGVIEDAGLKGDFGKVVVLRFEYRGQMLYAAYCHLSLSRVTRHESVRRGEVIGFTGNTGNARSMRGEDQHLHFEIRTTPIVGRGLNGRVDPQSLYGRPPMGWAMFDGHGEEIETTGTGLKVSGVNVRSGGR